MPSRKAPELKNICRIDIVANAKGKHETHGWQFKAMRDRKQQTKFFADSVYGTPELALAAAQAYRREIFPEIGDFEGYWISDALPSSNTSGIVGVHRSESIRQDESIEEVWQTTTPSPDGKRRYRQYRIHVHGERGALYKAVEERLDAVSALIGAPRYATSGRAIANLVETYLPVSSSGARAKHLPGVSRSAHTFGVTKTHWSHPMKIRLFALLGVILVVSMTVLVVFFRDVEEGKLPFEIAKALLQLGLVAIVGTAISLFVSEYQLEQARMDKVLDREQQEQVRARELNRQRHEYRDDLLNKTLSRTVSAYAGAKRSRRLLRARVGVGTDAPGSVTIADYDRYMEAVNDAQLELESLKGDVRTSAVAFSRTSEIAAWLESMEQYLGRVLKEYEGVRHRVVSQTAGVRFDQFEALRDFLGKAAKGNGFKEQVVDPFHSVQEAIRADLLHPKLPR